MLDVACALQEHDDTREFPHQLPRAATMKPILALLALLFSTSAYANDTSRIAIMSAFEPEWVVLQEKLTDRHELELNGINFLTGKIEGKDVVLLLSGVSMVNAAMSTQMTLDHFNISSIVFSGIAGGVNPEFHIGDVVVPARWGQYLEAHFAREIDGKFSPPTSKATGLANFGMMFPRQVGVARSGGTVENKFWFETDPKLLKVAEEVTSEINLEECVEQNRCLTHNPAIHVGGNGVSGQAFVDNAEFRKYAFNTAL